MAETDARHANALETTRVTLEAARAEAVEAWTLVDKEEQRVKAEAERGEQATRYWDTALPQDQHHPADPKTSGEPSSSP